MKEKIKVAYVGLGRRGTNMLKEALVKMNDVEIVMLCDIEEAKLIRAKKIIEDRGRVVPVLTTNYQDVLENDEIDAVFLFTNWNNRVSMAKSAMLAKKYTAIEVGCAANLEECFELVEIYEKTGVPVMMMENICYGKRELMAFNMVKQGLFGEVVHCDGGYGHYLNKCELFLEMIKGEEKQTDTVSHYRLAHYINGNCENYPTHALGPISKCLGINRGNRMVTLSSFASKSRGLKQFAKDKFGEDNKYAKTDYKQGDIVTTVITCANGETIRLTLDTTLPRPFYSRMYSIRGTKGMSLEDSRVFYTDDMQGEIRDNEDEMFKKYGHPLHKEVEKYETEESKIKEGFGLHADGVDWIIFRAFIESVKNNTNTPIDAYDTAAWLAIGPLSRKSIENGGQPVEIPDFTNGKWKNREPFIKSKYCLDEVIIDDSIGIYDSLN